MRRPLHPPIRFALLAAALTLLAWSAAPSWNARQARGPRAPLSVGLEDDADAQAEMEFRMLRDPRTGAIPRGIHQRELSFARTLPRRGVRLFGSLADPARAEQVLSWTERGPDNVGGRTRAFAIDVTNAGTLIAGSVAGGMWKSVDGGASWSLKTAPGQLHGMTCVTQDRRAGKTGVWYAGTGEIRGSTTNDTRWGSLYRGDGVFKSTDGGESWSLLPATSSGTPQTTDAFDFVIDVATNSANLAQDEVFAATYNGIYRSLDGGASWVQSIASDSGFTDVAVTSTGVVYASTRSAGAIRVWRSPNGVSWTLIQPGGFPASANRVVIGLAPSNAATVYFFVQGASNTPAVAGHQLWKYGYVSGDGSGVGGTWVNRGANLPPDINTQGGYDMVLNVKPDDESFVILGGTNLYRSTNGFSTTGATTTIGGYPFYPALNHHPDLHAGAFSPASPTVYYSAGDGGLAKAADITLASMVWTTLNHGYNVTQFYSVSLQPDAGANRILAGAQDNGTQLGNAPGVSSWVQAYGGDGTIVEVSPAADDRLYTQYQGGQMQRQNYDGSFLTDITPAGATNQMFVNPIVLDPNNTSILYTAAGVSTTSSRIWRNDAIPNANTLYGWSKLVDTEVGAGVGYNRQISAIGVSTFNEPNVLYYGTTDGLVMKARYANTAAPVVTNVTPPGLNGGSSIGGFVRCIAVDPNDSNRALLAFGNYNFQSLWYTIDGGASWTDVEGNLAGPSGPSIRWACLCYAGAQPWVFLGTSIGVLSTHSLLGGATSWVQEAAGEIGNVIVGYMDYRASDGTLAVGTHGRGVFTTQISATTGVGDVVAGGRERPRLEQSYPNPAHGHATIAYQLPRGGPVSLRLYDVAGRTVQVLVDGLEERGRHEVRLAAGRLPSGTYTCVLRAGGVVETRKLQLSR